MRVHSHGPRRRWGADLNETLSPATLAFDASGTPFSDAYGDVYHSAASGPGQARHVFLHGNDLPGRWAEANAFTIVECGFGFGLNFLVTWHAWREDPRRCDRLHYVSIERHPFQVADLATLHARYPGFAPIAELLRRAWPVLVPGMHRLHLDDGKVSLTLVFADVADALSGLRVTADAFYLDGFAPERNPDMWSPRTARALARLAHRDATLATWSVARSVRDALASAGFVADRRAGFGRKREMLVAHFAPRWHAPDTRARPERARRGRAMVIGAGLAGSAVAARLAARGWDIALVDRAAVAASAASGLRAGVFQPHVSRDDCLLSRWTRAGFLYAQAQWPALSDSGSEWPWQRCGVLQLADGDANELRVAETAAQQAYPHDYAQYVTREAASTLAGAHVGLGGWWFARAGWVRPGAIVAMQLAATRARLTLHLHREISTLRRDGGIWYARDADGAVVAQAPIVVLANADQAVRLTDADIDPLSYPLREVRGQQSYLPTPPFAAPRAIVGGDGYVLPAHEGIAVVGATYDLDRSDLAPDAASHAQNLARAARMLPGSTESIDIAHVHGAVGIRCVARDRMPMLGALVDLAAARENAAMHTGAHLIDLPRLPGIYAAFAFASRGLAWTLLAGELLAAQLEGEPLPIEGALVDAMDPGRFMLHRLRHKLA